MTADDPREELAAIAAAVRQYVERERATGGAELLAQVAAASRRRGPAPGTRSVESVERSSTSSTATIADAPRAATPATNAWGAAIPASAPRPSAAPDPAAAPPATSFSTGPSTSLFGEAAPHAAPAPFATTAGVGTAPPPAPRIELPPVHPPLAPIDPAGRATIDAAALPVLGEIADLARACRKCGLCDTRTKAVPGVGSARTGIVFVGEAPGADEDARGEPFVGRAGQLLTQIIQAMHDRKLIPGVPLDRSTVFICNVLKCRPPENRNPLPHEIEACSPYLRRQLEVLQPRVICCLGKFAAELLVGVKGTIGGLRGKVYRYQGAKLIVTYHPAACLRNPGYKRPVWEDMQLLAREYLDSGVA